MRRAGATLIEVLVAIFVMGIGLLALLTLFPIGALRMMQAIQEQRCADCSVIAYSMATLQNVPRDPSVVTNGVIPDLFRYLEQPAPTPWVKSDDYGPSFAVFVDPVGDKAALPGNNQDWVGGIPGLLRRRPVSFAPTSQTVYNWFTLWDDLTFDGNNAGAPERAAGTTVLRDTRYSWAYLCQRPISSDATHVDVSVVVYNRRPVALTATLSLQENVYGKAYFDLTSNQVTIDYSSPGTVPPPVKPGDWILDASIIQRKNGQLVPHAYFYRVVGVNEFTGPSGNTYAQYEVQTPLRGFNLTADPTVANSDVSGNTLVAGTVIVLDGVAEVFEKGPARIP